MKELVGEPEISVVVPVYNEIELLEGSILELGDFLRGEFSDFEILVVESGSTDGSAAVADHLAATVPAVRVIHEGVRRGFGSAIRRGFREARGSVIVVVTVDRPFPLESILVALETLRDHDAVLSYRSSDPRGLRRQTQSEVYNRLARLLLGLPVRHVNSALKVYRRNTLRSLALSVDDWLIDTEIVYRLSTGGFRFIEIPVPFIERTAGNSTVTLRTAVELFFALLRFSVREDRIKPATRRSQIEAR